MIWKIFKKFLSLPLDFTFAFLYALCKKIINKHQLPQKPHQHTIATFPTMSDHSSSVFNNSCLKVPRRPLSGQPFPACEQKHLNQLRNQAKKLVDEKMKSPKSTIKSFLEFFGSIPEYDDVNHLSNKEFYRRLENLREKQKLYQETFKLENEGMDWLEEYKSFSRKTSASSDSFGKTKPPSRRSVRIETPDDASFRAKAWDDLSVEDLKLDLDQSETSKSAPASPIRSKSSVGWKDTITIPQPFQMTVR